jgi:nucleoside-diphosphate-sugar epimerase
LSRHPHLKLKYAPARANDVSYSCADITRAASRLAYKPKTELREGVADVLDWFGMRRVL